MEMIEVLGYAVVVFAVANLLAFLVGWWRRRRIKKLTAWDDAWTQYAEDRANGKIKLDPINDKRGDG